LSLESDSRRVLEELSRAQEQLRADILLGLGGSKPPPHLELYAQMAAGLAANPQRVRELQSRHQQEQLALWSRFFGPGSAEALSEDKPDRRFSAPEWRSSPWFEYLYRTYVLYSRSLQELAEAAHVEEPVRRKLRFHTRQLVDAMAPSNYVATNPEAIKLALRTQGESIARGLTNLAADVRRGRISMTDESAFEVGRNLALTPGAVVYQNELMQLIQYRPLTPSVHQLPLVMVPPCINKYYILDLQPENSFVRHAAAHGITVFMISWRNIPPALGQMHWDDYLELGVMRAIEVARAICGVKKVNALGFCVGGTLLACALAVLRRKRRRPAASLTLLATMLDYAQSGDISVYVDEAYVTKVEQELGGGGILPGGQLAQAFASLRANDLVWQYVVNNYLKGRTPAAFDLLYWNSDSANLPGPMYAYYVRQMYLENALRVPDRLTMCGAPVDLGRIDLPTYMLATAEDHIVPWTSAYAGTRLLGEKVEFVLGASGHIAGIVNPPSKDRRSFRTGPIAPTPEAWLETSAEHPGSWWKHWTPWIKARSGAQRPARTALGSSEYAELEAAPGRYVRERH
jgi:polyhydroxyalkanoate synthase